MCKHMFLYPHRCQTFNAPWCNVCSNYLPNWSESFQKQFLIFENLAKCIQYVNCEAFFRAYFKGGEEMLCK